jgi:hypothetical protein
LKSALPAPCHNESVEDLEPKALESHSLFVSIQLLLDLEQSIEQLITILVVLNVKSRNIDGTADFRR